MSSEKEYVNKVVREIPCSLKPTTGAGCSSGEEESSGEYVEEEARCCCKG